MPFDRYFTHSQLDEVASNLLEHFPAVRLWAFSGELGTGKTTLIKSICLRLGATGNMSSPTFSMISEYETKAGGKLYHFDFYRIKNIEEAISLGIEDYLFSNEYCFIEWPERLAEALPPEILRIRLSFSEQYEHTQDMRRLIIQ